MKKVELSPSPLLTEIVLTVTLGTFSGVTGNLGMCVGTETGHHREVDYKTLIMITTLEVFALCLTQSSALARVAPISFCLSSTVALSVARLLLMMCNFR